MLRKITCVYVGFFVFLVLFQLFTRFAEFNFSIAHVLYWLFLVGWLLVVFSYKLPSRFSMGVGLAVMVSGMVLFVLGLYDFAETIARYGFVAWMVGMAQALIEYRR